MKVVLFCGGLGLRIRDYSKETPKPMVKIGYRPILWHLMKYYAHYGHRDFVLCLGHQADMIKDYFLDYYAHKSNITVDLESGTTEIHNGNHDNWKVHLVDTGLNTQTGGRLRQLRPWLDDGEIFHFTYGDGVADIDIDELVRFHEGHGKLATVTAVRSPSRFGRMVFDESRISRFHEKPHAASRLLLLFFLGKEPVDFFL